MRRPLGRIIARLNEPVMADKSIDAEAALVWFAASLWGFWAVIAGVATITLATNSVYESIWGISIFISGAIAGGSASATFIPTSNILQRIKRKRVEFGALCVLLGFLSVYPALLLVLSLAGDWSRVAPFYGSLPLVIFAVWRLRHLYRRMSLLRKVMAQAR